jgi:hypothetical protein
VGASEPGLRLRRITDEKLLDLHDELGPELFARECLNLWDPSVLEDRATVIPLAWWEACESAKAVAPVSGLAFAVDVSPDRASASIAISAPTGNVEHVEVIPPPPDAVGADWVLPRLVELVRKWNGVAVAVHLGGPVGSLEHELRLAFPGKLKIATDRDLTQACGQFHDAVRDRELIHIGQPALREALEGAVKSTAGDAWRWSRRNSTVNIAPLVAVTLARWASVNTKRRRPAPRILS